jgi:acetylornithine/succinyldiaminopimelate/putrescine aminotransferase/predicted amino acid dehydrogenase
MPSTLALSSDRQEDDLYDLIKPQLCQLLDLLGIGEVFHRAHGDYLYYEEDGEEVAVLDLIGGYGSLLLGHNHPAVVAEARRFLSEGRPVHAQGSRHVPAGRLAQELGRRAGGSYHVVFANSGAEAVETAMKHAILETGSLTFIALEKGFHGKTLGAVQLTSSQNYREPFEITGLTVLRVRANDIEDLERAFASAEHIAGFVFEPIQGEGGVRPLDVAFVERAAALCAARGVPLIADEIQTGMGRTGTFLACERLGVSPDYVLLSKALGGGLAKISATLIKRERYVARFDMLHTSTYAEDDYSSLIALKTLELIDDMALAECCRKGQRLLDGLRALMAAYPDVIVDVRGHGLMVGVEFRNTRDSASFMLRLFANQDDLVYVLVGYLFNVHRIRVAPTLSDPRTLRLEPSVGISDREICRILSALGDVCAKLEREDIIGLTRYFVEGPENQRRDIPQGTSEPTLFVYDEAAHRRRESEPSATKVAWLFHLIDADDLVTLEPGAAALTFEERERFLRHLAPRSTPILMSSFDVQSLTGAAVRCYAILLPHTSRQMKQWLDDRDFLRVRDSIDKAIRMARGLGCDVVTLGQYTSILTRNATTLRLADMGLTTGNTYTIALALDALKRAQVERNVNPASATLAIVGALGNIGETCAEILAPGYARTVLVGSPKPGARRRLSELQRRLPRAEIATDPAAVWQAAVVLAAANAPEPFLSAGHFARGAILCDLSVPAAVRPDVRALRSDMLVIHGGLARLPFGEDHGIVGFPLPAGHVYGCMGEALLLGLEGVRDATFTGALLAENVVRLKKMAERHGLALAEYKTEPTMGDAVSRAR